MNLSEHDNLDKKIRLQVLISSFGKKGIQNIAVHNHPKLADVCYLVSWQTDGCTSADIPQSLLERDDFRIIMSETRGLTKNRNLALDAASGPLCLISDDDVSYTEQQLRDVIHCFDIHPDCELLTFRYYSKEHPVSYPANEFDLANPPKGYFITSFEMAFRLDAVRCHKLRFNELFGIGGEFIACEEDIFYHEAMKAGIKGRFIPITIVTHESPTTSIKYGETTEFIRAKGAALSIIHPYSWVLRMISHSSRLKNASISKHIGYCSAWMSGVRDLRRLKMEQRVAK